MRHAMTSCWAISLTPMVRDDYDTNGISRVARVFQVCGVVSGVWVYGADCGLWSVETGTWLCDWILPANGYRSQCVSVYMVCRFDSSLSLTTFFGFGSFCVFMRSAHTCIFCIEVCQMFCGTFPHWWHITRNNLLANNKYYGIFEFECDVRDAVSATYIQQKHFRNTVGIWECDNNNTAYIHICSVPPVHARAHILLDRDIARRHEFDCIRAHLCRIY